MHALADFRKALYSTHFERCLLPAITELENIWADNPSQEAWKHLRGVSNVRS
jgi:hypothetical protein